MKKWEDMTVAEKKKERARVREVYKRLEEEEYNSDSQRIIRALSGSRIVKCLANGLKYGMTLLTSWVMKLLRLMPTKPGAWLP